MVFEELAERFPQLYVCPAEDAEEAYKRAVTKGVPPSEHDLSHFCGTDDDWLRVEQTPAGLVEVLFLKCREDFETFLRCTTHRCCPDVIPPSIGAMTIDGLADWQRVRAKRLACASMWEEGGREEFDAFLSDRTQYRITLVVLSEGPYSALDASRTPYGREEWLVVSREIRLYHELAHVTCRRLMPDDKPPVWDELTADAHGLLRATGHYDASLALRFLGIEEKRYVGGRLEEYLDVDQSSRMDDVAVEVAKACEHIAHELQDADPARSYDLLLDLKHNPSLSY